MDAFISSITDHLTIDIETDGNNPYTAGIKCVCFGTSPTNVVRLKDRDNIQQLLNLPVPKLGHNIKFDVKVLNQHGYSVRGPYEDTFILAQMLQKVDGKYLSAKKNHYKLKKLVNRIWGTEYLDFTKLLAQYNPQTKKADMKIDKIPEDVLVEYCKNDCKITDQLFEKLKSQARIEDLWVYNNIEQPLIPRLIDMEMTGIKVDMQKLEEVGKEVEKELIQWREATWSLAGYTFNINSNPQLKHIFYGVWKHPIVRKTSKGNISLNDGTLTKLAEWGYELAILVQGYRSLYKLKTSFIDKFKYMVNPYTGRLHCSFSQTGAGTGRFSCKYPNLQQIPPFVRKIFVADEGKVLIGADYSQVELRILAHLADDPVYIEMFLNGEDPHTKIAEMFGSSRKVAKTINFGNVYGQTAYGLAKNAGCTVKEAEEFLRRYHERFPTVQAFGRKKLKEMLLKKDKIVTTLFGRGRRIDIEGLWEETKKMRTLKKKSALKEKLYRIAINTAVQGTCADIIKMAMKNVFNSEKLTATGAQLLLQIHDELIFEVAKDKADEAMGIIREVMENVVKLKVPLKVDIHKGANWGELK